MAKVEFINNTEPYLNAENLNNNFQYCLPTGGISIYAGTTAPEGYLICDGSAISRTNYADLFEIIGTTYGGGDGTTTFNIPNLKGRVPVGADANDTDFDVIGETGGSKYLQQHRHEVGTRTGSTGSGGYGAIYQTNSTSTEKLYTSYEGTGDSGNLQPYIVMNYIIKY